MSYPTVRPGQTRIGWVGTGVMGRWMCQHLIDAGYSATVSNRTRSKADPLVGAGATYADTPREVAEASDVVFTIVGYPDDVREVTLGRDGVLAGGKPGLILVEMTTSRPTLAEEIAAAFTAERMCALDAPVSGGDVGAREARLSVMCGGDRGAFDAVEPLFEIIGRTIVYQGPAGKGQHTKVVNQTLIASGIVGVCEALMYAYKAGLDPETVLQSVSAGAAGSWSLTNYGPRMIRGDYEPGFYVEHFIKDMGIALDEAERLGLAMPGLALARQLYVALRSQGHGRKGIQALLLALESLSGAER